MSTPSTGKSPDGSIGILLFALEAGESEIFVIVVGHDGGPSEAGHPSRLWLRLGSEPLRA